MGKARNYLREDGLFKTNSVVVYPNHSYPGFAHDGALGDLRFNLLRTMLNLVVAEGEAGAGHEDHSVREQFAAKADPEFKNQYDAAEAELKKHYERKRVNDPDGAVKGDRDAVKAAIRTVQRGETEHLTTTTSSAAATGHPDHRDVLAAFTLHIGPDGRKK